MDLSSETQERMNKALKGVIQAGEEIRKIFKDPNLTINYKDDQTPVTVADQKSEDIIASSLHKYFPQDGILAEEKTEVTTQNGFRWIIDPLDGTQSFISGVPQFGILVGLEHNEDALLGIVYFPAFKEIFFAIKGQGAKHALINSEKELMDVKKLHVSQKTSLEEAFICYTTFDDFKKTQKEQEFLNIIQKGRKNRGWGDCFGHMLVATGRCDVMLDPTLKLWDIAALKPIIEEAGGSFTDVSGRNWIYGQSAISSNGKFHQDIITMLNPGLH